jgi:hypothetical protein
MKPGGWGIMQVPQDFDREITFEDPTIVTEEDRERLFWQRDHVRLFGKDYPNWLQNAGFKVEVFEKEKKYSTEQIQRFRLQKKFCILYTNHKK